MLRKYIVETDTDNTQRVPLEKTKECFVKNGKLVCIFFAEDEKDIFESSNNLPVDSIQEVALTLADKPYIPKD